jgi:hypothetical protein
VTFRLLIACDGTPADRDGMALARCRAFLPVGNPATDTPDELVAAANRAGYRVTRDGRHLCPDCTRGATTTTTTERTTT